MSRATARAVITDMATLCVGLRRPPSSQPVAICYAYSIRNADNRVLYGKFLASIATKWDCNALLRCCNTSATVIRGYVVF